MCCWGEQNFVYTLKPEREQRDFLLGSGVSPAARQLRLGSDSDPAAAQSVLGAPDPAAVQLRSDGDLSPAARQPRLDSLSPAAVQPRLDAAPNLAVVQLQLGARVRALRDESGLTQADLALASDMDRSQLAAIETGRRNVTLANLARLARALGVTLSQLLDGVDG